jgi:hypothetical protein
MTVHLRLQVQLRMKVRSRLSMNAFLSAEEPETAADFVLANDGRGVAVADAMLVGEPVRALIATQEGGPGF